MRKRSSIDAPVPRSEDWEGVSAGVKRTVEKEMNVVIDGTSFRQIASEIKASGKGGNSLQAADDVLHRLGFNPRMVDHYDAYKALAFRLRGALLSDPQQKKKHLNLVEPAGIPPAEQSAPEDTTGTLTDAEWKRIRRQIPIDRHNIDAETDKGWHPDAEA